MALNAAQRAKLVRAAKIDFMIRKVSTEEQVEQALQVAVSNDAARTTAFHGIVSRVKAYLETQSGEATAMRQAQDTQWANELTELNDIEENI
jgi:hypothetical protein